MSDELLRTVHLSALSDGKVWLFENRSGSNHWENFLPQHNAMIEQAYQNQVPNVILILCQVFSMEIHMYFI